MNSSTPHSHAFEMYSVSVWPDITTIIGYSSFLKYCLIYFDVSNPSKTGMLRSIKIRPYENTPSYWDCLTMSIAIYPLKAESMIDSMLGMFNWQSTVFKVRTLKGSSSTIKILRLFTPWSTFLMTCYWSITSFILNLYLL